jgi:ribonuclease HI
MTYSYGAVVFTQEGKEVYNGKEDNEDLAEMRNVSGEIKGAMVAMEVALEKGKDILYLHYDYMGIEQWATGQWKTNKDGTKAYKAYYDSIKDRLKVEFVKVKAHSGIEYNEEADRLAKEALM